MKTRDEITRALRAKREAFTRNQQPRLRCSFWRQCHGIAVWREGTLNTNLWNDKPNNVGK